MRTKVTDYVLYRWRYIVGYGIVAVAFAGLLLLAGLAIPGGLSHSEMASVVASSSLSVHSFAPSSIINLPYHLLQRASINLFGLSTFSIKLPSLILGMLAGLGMLILLQAWFRRNVAVLTSLLVVTTGQFLFIAQDGTPSIVYIFWSVWLLVAAMMISRRASYLGVWKVVLLSMAALSLYTPLSAYILIALASAIALHPHLRYLIRRVFKARLKVTIALICAALLLVPLVYALIKQPSIGLTLLGIPHASINIIHNGMDLLRQSFDFLTPTRGPVMTPIYSLGSMILILLGILHLITTKYTARSYIISIWSILLLPVLVVNPTITSVAFVPAMLLLAMGIQTLLSNWYRLFPRNPYARLAGLIPLTILIAGMVITGVDRYMYGYLYDPQTANNFSHDLQLVNEQLSTHNRTPIELLVTPAELPFYRTVAAYHPHVSVETSPGTPHAATVIVSHDAHPTVILGTPWRIITGHTTEPGDRFYIYKTDQK